MNYQFHNFTGDTNLNQSILGYGIKHAPPPSDLTRLEIDQSLWKFKRNLIIKQYFTDERQQHNAPFNPMLKKLKPASNWMPRIDQQNPYLVNLLDTFTAKVSVIVQQTTPILHGESSTTRLARQLAKDGSIKIVQTDKNLGLAVLKTSHYHHLISTHLHNGNYTEIDKDAFDTIYYLEQEDLFKRAQTLPRHLRKHLKSATTTTVPKFHGILKIHKEYQWPDIPIRPIIGIQPQTLQQMISIITTIILLPIQRELQTVLNNSLEMIQDIEGIPFSSQQMQLVTLDFVSLYPSINLDDMYTLLAQNIPQHSQIFHLLREVFRRNYFTYAGQYYRQKDGIAMGTSVAPILANIYLYYKVDTFIINDPSIQHYHRFIDDGFFIYHGSKDDLTFTMEDIADQVSPMNITSSQSTTNIPFLDLDIHHDDNKIYIKVYEKALSIHAYLTPDTSHPLPTLKGFILGEVIRYRRICTLDADFIAIRKLLFIRLQARGYDPLWLYTFMFKPVTRNPPIKVQGTSCTVLSLRFTRSTSYPSIRSELKELEKTIQSEINERTTLMLSFSQSPNLAQLCLRSDLTREQISFLDENG